MELGSYFLFLQEQINDIIIMDNRGLERDVGQRGHVAWKWEWVSGTVWCR
jgi:hypothetical protein